MRRILAMLAVVIVATIAAARGQNIVSITGGAGTGSENFYPDMEARSVYGLKNFGLSWRNYSAERNVGCVGIDLEYLQRGFSISPYASSSAEDERHYYTRRINSLIVPIVWQPYVYMLENRVRLFFEAAATFSYDMSSTYDNDYERDYFGDEDDGYAGKYNYKLTRDNRFGYGLAFGGGLSYLVGRYEVMGRVRYYMGFSDVVRNRNKYYDNGLDGFENPFALSPLRSPLNNLMINVGVGYHFGPAGFKSWEVKRVKREKMNKGFNYDGVK